MVLFIYGASSAAREVYDMVERNRSLRDRYTAIYFIDDFQDEADFYGAKRIRFSSCGEYADPKEAEFIIAVGEPSARRLLYDKVVSSGYTLTTLIDETAIISHTAIISAGCIIGAGAIVSSDAVIRENCFLMFHTIVGHDAVVNRDCMVCPKATVGGFSVVGEQTFLGLGSSMKEDVNAGSRVIVGLGSKLFRDVEDGVTVIGNPARVTKGNTEHKVFH